MSMFCYQCQETARNSGCTLKGVCGKNDSTANYQDLLIYSAKGLSEIIKESNPKNQIIRENGELICEALFMTITNANFDDEKIIAKINQLLSARDNLIKNFNIDTSNLSFASRWSYSDRDELKEQSEKTGILQIENEDIRSLTELMTYGLKGIAAYTDHASILGFYNDDIFNFIIDALALSLKENDSDTLIQYVIKTGECAVKAMELLDKANTETYGNPEISKVNIGVRNNPGILISGHDLKDMEQLLDQTEGTGIDVYTHSEMLPANYYPKFKKYKHFAGNYGNAWWKQNTEFDTFNGPILMTTNCITPVRDSYKGRIFTTGMAGYPEIPHIESDENGNKDFSAIIELAKDCPAPKEIENGEIVGGFAHHQVSLLADKIVDAVKSGAVKKFVVMAGCDGRHKSREYFTEIAERLPKDTIILTAGCAKYRYNKLNLGDIGGIPRVLDAGQCNDSYSLAITALKLKEAFELEDINDLPLDFDIAWYEQKAVAVLLALLSLGFKGIRLGPTLPAFLSPNVAKILIKTFDLKATTTADEDIAAINAK